MEEWTSRGKRVATGCRRPMMEVLRVRVLLEKIEVI